MIISLISLQYILITFNYDSVALNVCCASESSGTFLQTLVTSSDISVFFCLFVFKFHG